MGLQGPPYAVLSPLVTDPLAPPGDPESSLFLTCHFVLVGPTRTKWGPHTAYRLLGFFEWASFSDKQPSLGF